MGGLRSAAPARTKDARQPSYAPAYLSAYPQPRTTPTLHTDANANGMHKDMHAHAQRPAVAAASDGGAAAMGRRSMGRWRWWRRRKMASTATGDGGDGGGGDEDELTVVAEICERPVERPAHMMDEARELVSMGALVRHI